MPGQGRIVERDYTADERAALGDAAGVLGQTTFDIYLNGNALLAQRPGRGLALQAGRLSGAQEVVVVPGTGVLGRALMPEEVLYFAEMARRIGIIVRYMLRLSDYRLVGGIMPTYSWNLLGCSWRKATRIETELSSEGDLLIKRLEEISSLTY